MKDVSQKVYGRVVAEHKASYVVFADGKEYIATLRGHFHGVEDKKFPKVGDLVLLTVLGADKAVIEEIKPRKSEVVRKSAHDDTEQVMVANVDYIFIVMGLDGDFNIRRLERYLVLAEQAHITPVVILNKADIVANVEEYKRKVQEVAAKAEVHIVSAKTGMGMEIFFHYLEKGKTAVLLGSSGAGKSTITNYLLQEASQDTTDVRQDSRGRHTTTTRELFMLPSGGFLIDTPGMRELGFVKEDEINQGTFADIEHLAQQCRFSNCDHIKSAGCKVQEALQSGDLDEKHFNNYIKLQSRHAETRASRKRD